MAEPSIHPQKWDIFCRVIDNFGDIGVCWRLARQLADEYGFSVRLWLDDIASLKCIYPGCTLSDDQWLDGVSLRIWQSDFQVDYIADVVIEAFACHIPDIYIAQMKRSQPPTSWLNLEYLSAESWIEGCHQLSSLHPQTGLKKAFFFPGFTDATGGLIRENDLISRRDHFLFTNQKSVFLEKLGINSDLEHTTLVSLFSYENESIKNLMTTWALAQKPIICLVPRGKSLAAINQALEITLTEGDHHQLGALEIIAIPFLSQKEYDHLLWSCDINFVRGEDSFVRAQWAAKPFIWQIYPQEDGAHLDKLKAFLDRYAATATPELKAAVETLWHQWNHGEDCEAAWQQALNQQDQWVEHSQLWCNSLLSMPNLASNLVHFCQKAL